MTTVPTPERERMGPKIVAGLEEAVRALDAGDTDTAARALEAVSQACDTASAQTERLTPAELSRASELYTRCQQAAQVTGDGLVASLLQSAKLRSASNAYKSRP